MLMKTTTMMMMTTTNIISDGKNYSEYGDYFDESDGDGDGDGEVFFEMTMLRR